MRYVAVIGWLLAVACVPSQDAPPLARGAAAAGAPAGDALVDAAALRDRAERDLGCAELTLEAAWTGGVLRATGCGKHALYVEARRGDVAFLPLSAAAPDAASAGGSWDWDFGSIDGHPVPARLALELNLRGAHDLACPRDEVVPVVVSSRHAPRRWHAVGCGRVAQYDCCEQKEGEPRLRGDDARIDPACGPCECTDASPPGRWYLFPVRWRPLESPASTADGPGVRVRFESGEASPVMLMERRGEAWRAVCAAPCDARVDPGGTYELLGGAHAIDESAPFSLPTGLPYVELRAGRGERSCLEASLAR